MLAGISGGLSPRSKTRPLNLAAISGCEFWIDAARAATIIYASGVSVQQMQDLSGKGRHLTKTGAGNDAICPAYVAAERGVQFLNAVTDQMAAGNAGDWNFLHNGLGATILMMVKISADASSGTLLSTAAENAAGVGTNLFFSNGNQTLSVTTRNGTTQALAATAAPNALQKDVTQLCSVHIESRVGIVPDLITRNKGVTDINTNALSTFATGNSTDKLYVSRVVGGSNKGKFILKKLAMFSRRLRPEEEQAILRAWAKEESIALSFPSPRPLAVIAGSDNAKGRGLISETGYAGGAATISNAFIWNATSSSWPTLTAGTNNDAFDTAKLGVEMSLAKNFVTNKNLPLYLVKNAVDSTTLTQWLNGSANFTTLRDTIQKAVWSIEDAGAVCKPAAFIWYQGETDATVTGDATAYATRLQAFISDVSTIYGVAQIPFYIVQIQGNPNTANITTVQQAELTTAMTLPYSAYTNFVETGDIAVLSDASHVTAATYEALGQRIVERIKI